jgi:hypothetical protein
MEREVFTQRFHEASAQARDFCRQFIDESLPDPMLFCLRLNASYDGNPLHEDERVFPEDSDGELARRLSRCTADEVVDVLWRDGIVPEWVNLTVIGEIETATLIEVLSCGRFTANEQLLYHQEEGRPPFHVLGPSLPVGFEHGQKFSIYNRSECWTRDELGLTARHAAKVWSLQLYGEDFDDEMIASLPVFDRMHILELRASRLNGCGLAGLSRQPTLHHLRLYLNHEGPFTAAHLPKLHYLQTVTIENLPAGSWGFPAIAAETRLNELWLSTDHELLLDARLHGAFSSLTLRARSIDGEPLPEKIVSLHLHLRDASDDDVERLLARVNAVTHLSLEGSPVSDNFVESLVSRWKLEYLNVVDTLVGDECVRRIRARYPKLRTHPNPDFKLPKSENDL